MIKTFAFVLYVFFNDGTQHKIFLASGVSPERCAEMLTEAVAKPIDVNQDLVKEAIVACEEETSS